MQAMVALRYQQDTKAQQHGGTVPYDLRSI
jgi:hypothetical protein